MTHPCVIVQLVLTLHDPQALQEPSQLFAKIQRHFFHFFANADPHFNLPIKFDDNSNDLSCYRPLFSRPSSLLLVSNLTINLLFCGITYHKSYRKFCVKNSTLIKMGSHEFVRISCHSLFSYSVKALRALLIDSSFNGKTKSKFSRQLHVAKATTVQSKAC